MDGSDGRARGMEVEMDGGLSVSESPLAPLKGGDIQMPWPVPAGHCSGQPDGAAAQDGMRCAIVETRCAQRLYGTGIMVHRRAGSPKL